MMGRGTPLRHLPDSRRARTVRVQQGESGNIVILQAPCDCCGQLVSYRTRSGHWHTDANGFVGVTMFAPFLKRGPDATVEDYLEAIDYVINVIGEDKVGIGTDFTQDQDDAFFEYICHDKGYGWRVTGPLGEVVNPTGIRTLGEFPNLTAAMEKARWPEAKIRKVMGENWLRLLADVWGG